MQPFGIEPQQDPGHDSRAVAVCPSTVVQTGLTLCTFYYTINVSFCKTGVFFISVCHCPIMSTI